MYLSIRNGVCKVFARNEVGQSNKKHDKLWEQECGMSVMSVSDRHVCQSLWTASAPRMNPYATATTRKPPSAESARTLERHLHDPRKILSIALFLQVVPSFLRLLSFQGFHFLVKGVKGQCFLNKPEGFTDEDVEWRDIGPLKSEGASNFQNTRRPKLTKWQAGCRPLYNKTLHTWDEAQLAAITDCWTCHHHWLLVGKTFLTGSWWKVEKLWLEGPGKEEKMRKQRLKSCHTSSSRSHGAIRESASRTSKDCCHLCSGSVTCSPRVSKGIWFQPKVRGRHRQAPSAAFKC